MALSGKPPTGSERDRPRLRVWLSSPIVGIAFRRSSSSTPSGCTCVSP
jgi:hypothetical protein